MPLGITAFTYTIHNICLHVLIGGKVTDDVLHRISEEVAAILVSDTPIRVWVNKNKLEIPCPSVLVIFIILKFSVQ